MNKNDKIILDITGTTAEGSGVGRHDGMAVFVQGAAEGDKISAHILKVCKNYAFAKVDEIIEASQSRVENDCEAFPKCGGCVFRHISYEAECRIKTRRVSDAFQRIGRLDVALEPIIAAKRINGYRNKAQYPVGMADGKLQIGFYAPHSHRIVDCRGCKLQPPEFERVLNVFAEYIDRSGISTYDEQTEKGILRHIYIRKAETTGEIMVCAVVNANGLPKAEMLIEMLKEALGESLKTVVINRNTEKTNVILSDRYEAIYGDGYITDILCGIKVRLSPLSFYQVNREMAELLYSKVAEFAEPQGKILLDLYCGAGTIGLSMVKEAKKVYGVEIIPEAVLDAKFNAAANGIENAEFICADAHEAAARLAAQGIAPDIVIVDPPRKGLESGLPELIATKLKPQSVVYVSCDPATLARDCAAFQHAGYEIKRAVPVDLFPRTAHVECVVLMSRVN